MSTGKLYEIHTPAQADFYRLWTLEYDHKHLLFDVQACADVHVALAEALMTHESYAYEVVIGAQGNTVSEIRNTTSGYDKHTVRL